MWIAVSLNQKAFSIFPLLPFARIHKWQCLFFNSKLGSGFSKAMRKHQKKKTYIIWFLAASNCIKEDRKCSELKECSFFTFLNYRQSTCFSTLNFLSKTTCMLGVINICRQYGYLWLQQQRLMFSVMSNILAKSELEAEELRKSEKFKQLLSCLVVKTYIRGTQILTQQSQHCSLMFIKSGQCTFSKTIFYSWHGLPAEQKIPVALRSRGAIIGGELLLTYNKQIARLKTQINKAEAMKLIQQNNENQNESNQIESNGPQLQPKRNFKRPFATCNISEMGSNKSNFTVTVTTSHLQVYAMGVQQLLVCDQLMRHRVNSYCEGEYKNLIIRCMQKMDGFGRKKEIQSKKIEKKEKVIQAKMAATKSKLWKGFTCSVKDSELMQLKDEALKILKNNKIANYKNKNLERKIEMVLNDNRGINYKQKIYQLLKQKICSMPTVESDNGNKEKEWNTIATNKAVDQLQEIIRKKVQDNNNIQNSLRCESIIKQQKILNSNERICKERNKVRSQLIVHKNLYDRAANKAYRISLGKNFSHSKSTNYLQGINMQQYTNHIKQLYSAKINRTNKIKQQPLTLHSDCGDCHCYDNVESIKTISIRRTPTSFLSHKTLKKNTEEPLEKIYNRMRFLAQKSKTKYSHYEHLKDRDEKTRQRRKHSAPIL